MVYKYRRLLPYGAEGAFTARAHLFPVLDQRIKLLLCFTELSLLLLEQTVLAKRTLV